MSKSLQEVLMAYPLEIQREVPALLDQVGDSIATGAWCQGPEAKNDQGEAVEADDENAVSWCYTGTLEMILEARNLEGNHARWLHAAALRSSDTQVPPMNRHSMFQHACISMNDDLIHTKQGDMVALARKTAAAVRELLPA